jgi:hypothetical protein
MEERTHAPEAPQPPVDPTVDRSSTALPTGAQVPLPFDDEAERPIAFRLTARARRTVAPDALPTLRVVRPVAPTPGPDVPTPVPDVPTRGPAVPTRGPDGTSRDLPAALVPRRSFDPADDDPSDTRPARARALRRSGVDLAAIATQLGVDELLVRAWTGGVVAPRHPARATGGHAPGGPLPAADEGADAASIRATRAAAREDATRRLAAEPGLAAGLGVLAGVAELGPRAVTVTTADPRVAGRVVRWLVDVLDVDPASVRLVLRVGPRAAADLARHRWGRAIGIDPERVRTTRAGAPADEAAVEGVLRVAGADLAATAAGWCDALLDGDVSAGF